MPARGDVWGLPADSGCVQRYRAVLRRGAVQRWQVLLARWLRLDRRLLWREGLHHGRIRCEDLLHPFRQRHEPLARLLQRNSAEQVLPICGRDILRMRSGVFVEFGRDPNSRSGRSDHRVTQPLADATKRRRWHAIVALQAPRRAAQLVPSPVGQNRRQVGKCAVRRLRNTRP
jgi:hypothetical protein